MVLRVIIVYNSRFQDKMRWSLSITMSLFIQVYEIITSLSTSTKAQLPLYYFFPWAYIFTYCFNFLSKKHLFLLLLFFFNNFTYSCIIVIHTHFSKVLYYCPLLLFLHMQLGHFLNWQDSFIVVVHPGNWCISNLVI